MSDPVALLTPTEIAKAELADWGLLVGKLKARFRTRTFATGLTLVNRIGEAAEAADHHPSITLTYTEVTIALWSHDARGVTRRDVDLARRISALARQLSCPADVQGLTEVELALDTHDGHALAPFYGALLATPVEAGELRDPSGQWPTLWWQEPGEADPSLALPPSLVTQRWHLDVWVPAGEVARRLAAVIDQGGRLVSSAAAPSYWVVEDAEGNRSCLCTAGEPTEEH